MRYLIALLFISVLIFGCEPSYKRNAQTQREKRIEKERRIETENNQIKERNYSTRKEIEDLVEVRSIRVLTLEGDTAYISISGSFTSIYIEKK